MILTEIAMGTSINGPLYKEFNGNTHCISYLFTNILGRYDNPYMSKLNIRIHSEEINKTEKVVEISSFKIVEVNICFDFNRYHSRLSVNERKQILFELLWEGIDTTIKELSLDLEPFQNVRDLLMSQGLDTEFTWGKAKWSRNRQCQAQVFYYFNLDDIEFGIRFYNKQGEKIQEEIIGVLMPHYMFIHPYLGQLKWLDNSSVELISRDKEEVFIARIKN